MPPLLTFNPSGATFSPIAADEYQKLLGVLANDPRVTKLVSSKLTGSCEVQGVDFAWTYDGANSLHVGITAKHGFFVGHVPNETIFDKLRDEFFT